jgi:hypothetical protein
LLSKGHGNLSDQCWVLKPRRIDTDFISPILQEFVRDVQIIDATTYRKGYVDGFAHFT